MSRARLYNMYGRYNAIYDVRAAHVVAKIMHVYVQL